jgi:hypothetical protein
MNWFTSGTQSAGTGVNNLLSGILSPLAGSANTLLGTTTQTETATPNQSKSKTGTYIIAALAVVVLIVVGIIIFKKSK